MAFDNQKEKALIVYRNGTRLEPKIHNPTPGDDTLYEYWMFANRVFKVQFHIEWGDTSVGYGHSQKAITKRSPIGLQEIIL